MRGKTLEQLVAEARADIGHMTTDELQAAVENCERLVILDIRDKELYEADICRAPPHFRVPR